MTIKKTSIILCTYNEENYIKDTISSLQKNINNLEIVIVDDNSKDGTRKIINDFSQPNNIRLIHRIKSRGLASAFLTGIIDNKGDYVGWTDSNMSELTIKFKEMIKLLDSGCDIVLLSRYIEGGGDNRTWLRSFSSKYFNLICRFVLGSNIKDYTSGIFLMNKKVLNELTFLGYGHGEFFIEFIHNANKKGFNIKEIPFVQGKDRDINASKTAGNIISFFYLGFFYILRIFVTLLWRG